MTEKKMTAAETYHSKKDRKKFLEIEKSARLLVEKIENSKGEG